MKERSNISLKPLDDIFSTEESWVDAQREKVTMVPLDALHPFRNHPFKVVDDEKMMDTAQSIREHGVLVPAVVRPLESGGYELVSGHRRKRGCELAGLAEMPVIIRDMDDDAAVLVMVDSNIQRESILPSEWAYTKKQGLVWQEVFLPPQAPREWRDREQLWNAVEAAEKKRALSPSVVR